MKISFIMATYNRKSSVGDAIDSYLNQEMPGTELIVVDDGSEDGSVERLQGYADRIRFVSLPQNHGVGFARNQALKLAAGKYVSILDSDNKLEDGAVEEMLRAIKAEEIAIYKFPVIFSSTGRQSFDFEGHLSGLDYLLNRPKVECHTLIKRELLQAHKFIEKFNGGEGIVWLDCALDSDEVKYIPVPTLSYRDSGDDRLSDRNSNARRIRQVHIEGIKRHARHYIRHNPFELLKVSAKITYYSLVLLVKP
jgi:glycosyltransferase involved in cell wall biosynthesis